MSGSDDSFTSTDSEAADKGTLARLKATGKLPSPQGVALEITQLSRQEYVSNAQITRIIQGDLKLAGRIVKAANMLTSGSQHAVIGVGDAVLALGLPVVSQLTLALSLLSENREGASKLFDYPKFWSRSLLMGTAMQAIALRLRLAKAEEMFAWGLLSGIGQIALANVHPEEYDDILGQAPQESGNELCTQERERLSVDHMQLSILLLRDWGCPETFARIALAIDNPEVVKLDEESDDYQLAQAIRLATSLTAAVLAGDSERRQLLPALLLIAAHSGIDAEELRLVFDEAVSQWRKWGEFLQLPAQEVLPLSEPSSQSVAGVQVMKSSASTSVDKAIYPLRVLAVDDDPMILSVLKRLLTSAGHTVYTAGNGAEALERALEFAPELVITDWVMPNKDGLQFCRDLRATKLGKGMYILLLTSFEDEERLVEAFEAGADDYVNKPFSPRALSARLRAAQRVLQLQEELRRDAEEIHRFATALTVTNHRLQQAAMTDALTDLPNRRYALDRLEQERAAVERRNSTLSCILINVDNFKRINDAFGHEAGDAALRHLAECLRRAARIHDAVARLGGDELLLICPDTKSADAFQCAERLRSLVAASPIVLSEQEIHLTISLGVATLGPGMNSISDLMARADQALHLAKAAGRNCSFVWNGEKGAEPV
jgi:two-component system, cell cycle response regulator